MRVAIYKDTLANRRGADIAVTELAHGLCERGHAAILFEKQELASRLDETWDVFISAGTNELLDLAERFPGPFPFHVVQQFHTNPASQFKWKRFLRNRRIRRALSKVSATQVLSQDFVRQAAKYGPPVTVIGNWSKWGNSVPIAGNGNERPVIIYPAAFSKRKNQHLLVRAFASLSSDFPDWTLELYGGGTPPKQLPDRVKAMGFRDDLDNIYDSCAFLAFPSLDEGFGLAIADAAAFGKPALMVRDWIGTAAAGGGMVTHPT